VGLYSAFTHHQFAQCLKMIIEIIDAKDDFSILAIFKLTIA